MSNSAIVAKSRAIYGTLLKKEDYDSLIHRSSVGAAVSYLKGTPRYKSFFSDADAASLHRGEVEISLGRAVFESYQRIRRFSAEKGGVMDFYLRSAEAEQLSKAITAISTGTQEKFYLALPDYLLDLLSFSAEKAARSANGTELLAALSGTVYEKPLAPYLLEDKLDVNKCISVVHGCYLRWIFEQLDRDYRGKELDELKRFFLRKAECDNVLLCYRLKRFFDMENERIRTLMLPYRWRLRPDEIDSALSAQNPSTALITLLSERCVPKNILVDSDFPENGIARADYSFFKRKLAFAKNEAEALYALIVLLETERTNLQKIIEGIRYSLPPQEIEQYVII